MKEKFIFQEKGFNITFCDEQTDPEMVIKFSDETAFKDARNLLKNLLRMEKTAGNAVHNFEFTSNDSVNSIIYIGNLYEAIEQLKYSKLIFTDDVNKATFDTDEPEVKALIAKSKEFQIDDGIRKSESQPASEDELSDNARGFIRELKLLSTQDQERVLNEVASRAGLNLTTSSTAQAMKT